MGANPIRCVVCDKPIGAGAPGMPAPSLGGWQHVWECDLSDIRAHLDRAKLKAVLNKLIEAAEDAIGCEEIESGVKHLRKVIAEARHMLLTHTT